MSRPGSIVLLLVLAGPATAQVREAWATNFDPGAQQDTTNAVACDGARVAVTGRSYDPTSGFPPPPPTSDIETVLYDANGNQLWSRRFDHTLPGDDVGYDVALIPGGGVAVIGNSSGYSGANYITQRTAIVYAANGNIDYTRVTGNTSTASFGRGLAIAANGDVILGGSDGVNGGDLCVERLDAIGSAVWTTTQDGGVGGTDLVYDVEVGPGGDVWAAGYVASAAGMRDLVVMRLAGATGAVQWIATFDGGGNQDDYALRIAVDANGRAFAAGVATVPGRGQDAVVVGVSPTGSILWDSKFDGGALATDSARRVVVDPFGRVVAGGMLATPSTGKDFAVWRFDPLGTLTWSTTWNGPFGGDDELRGLDVDAFGNVTAAGSSPGVGGSGDSDITFASWDSQGLLAFTHRDDGAQTGAQYASSIAVGANWIAASGSADAVPSGPLDYRTVVLTRTAVPFCLGDGSGAACPCSNVSATVEQAGCAHSFAVGGRIRAAGVSSLAADTLALLGSAMPNSSCLYFQGTTTLGGGLGAPFGDGLRCAGGTVIRLGTKTNVAGASQYPSGPDPSVSVRGGVMTAGTRTYQAWFRNSAAFCTSSTFNLTNGLSVTWST